MPDGDEGGAHVAPRRKARKNPLLRGADPSSSRAASQDQLRLSPGSLRWTCDPEALGFETTDDVPPLDRTVGQTRGVGALEFGLSQDVPGYNIYVVGAAGSGRSTTVRMQVGRAAATRPVPSDWCYLYNFPDPYQPAAVELPPGRGPDLARDLERFISSCQRDIPRAFESDQYEQRRSAVIRTLQQKRDAVIEQLRPVAEQLGFVIQLTPMGIVTLPSISPGVPMSPEAFELLTDERKAEIRERGQRLQRRLDEAIGVLRRIEREGSDVLHDLDRDVALLAVGQALESLRRKYGDQPRVSQFLVDLQADLMDHIDELRPSEGEQGRLQAQRAAFYDRYRANVLVTQQPSAGAPVVFEPNPTYYNLLGRIDYRVAVGAMQTDFSLIKPGALHRANGGFLVLQARDVLLSPFSWDALKRSLRDRQIRVENLGEQLSIFPTASLKPEPIPLRVKVILIGDYVTYMLLYRLDEDFRNFFKVKAQFGPAMERSPESVQTYAAFISGEVREHGLLPFRKDAVARVVEFGSRLVEHQERLATRFNVVLELIVEATHWARRGEAAFVTAGHVDQALEAQQFRSNLVEEELQRLIDDGTISIDTRTEAVGQVNGLSVMDLGDYAFARPSRISARTGLGSEGIVNIEREVELSGPTHSKGVLILSGYLLGTYAQGHPLAVSARLAFEQVYSEVDGDSASSAELYALLSSLSEVPIKQGIAVTGSVNQRGQIQAVGGVTTKIEGFFAVCKAQGLTGEQGVIIPESNVRHLMLRAEVVDAVAQGRFNVWAVRSVEEGIELLTGVPAGERQADGSFPEGSIQGKVERQLASMATRLAEYGRPGTPRRSRNGR